LDALFPGGLPHWPQLRVISCWSDGPAAPAAADLAARFPKATLQPKGLLSTEGVVSIPVDGAWPLAIRSHYLEFEQPDGTVVPAHRLEDHGCYRPVLTTGGGLWRYRTGDLVRVEGFVKRTASIRFVGRADSVSDLRGEKLSEAFVGEAIEQLGLRHFALLTPNDAGYTLFTESPQADTLAARLDALLMRNPHYAWARQLGQLDPVQGRQVPRGAAARVLARDTAEDRAAPKPRCLDTRPDWPRWLGVSTAGVRA
jgi:hypothetical protein